MKRIVKILLCLVAFLVINVNAFEFKPDKDTIYQHVSGEGLATTFFDRYGSSNRAHSPAHYISDGKDVEPMFCLDPTQLSPYDGGNDNKLRVDRFLYGEDNTFAIAEDYAISKILASSNYHGRLDTNLDAEEYGAVSLALRLFENGVIQNVNVSAPQYSLASILNYLRTLKQWVDTDTSFAELFQTTCSNVKSLNIINNVECDLDKHIENVIDLYVDSDEIHYSSSEKPQIKKDARENKDKNYGLYFVKTYNGYEQENDALSKGRKYLEAGMKAFNEAITKEGKLNLPKATVAEETIIRGKHSSTVIVSVDFKNFITTGSSYFNILSATAKNSTVKLEGYNNNVPQNATDYVSTNGETNILKLAGGNNKVYLVFTVTSNITYETEENCNIDFNLSYKYDDARLFTGAFIICNLYGDSSRQFQRFISISRGVIETLVVNLKQCETVCKPSNALPKNCSNAQTIKDGQVIATFKEGYDEDGELNISKCIVGNTDINGNSYEVDELKTNPYCSAYCKEDLEIKMPYRLETYPGRYINIDLEIKGTQSCYTSKIDYEKYNNDVKGLSGAEKIEKDNYLNECKYLGSKEYSDVKYQFDPKITYSYDEKIYKQSVQNVANRKTMKMVDLNDADPEPTISYCDSTYTKCVDSYDNNHPYVKSVKEKEATFTTPRIYFISHNRLGLVNIIDNPTKYDLLENNQVDGLPIDISTLDGTYNYDYTFEDIGTFYNNNGKLGRIYGGKDSLAAYSEDNLGNIQNEYACTYKVGGNYCINPNDGTVHGSNECNLNEETIEACFERLCPNEGNDNTRKCVKEKGEYYVCTTNRYDETTCSKSYGNTPEARQKALKDVGCNGSDGSICKNNVNCCPTCKVYVVPSCPACIVTNGGGSAFNYRTISTTNINPNDKDMGYNWNTNSTSDNASIKAKYTIEEIEQAEAKKYEESTSGSTENEVPTEYSLKVVMTADMARWIREEYNAPSQDKGSYTNVSLKCYDYEVDNSIFNGNVTKEKCVDNGYTWENKKCVIKSVLCYSDFIDELQTQFPENVIAPNRNKARSPESQFTNYTIEGASNQGVIVTDGYWTIFPTFVIEGAGPSWK